MALYKCEKSTKIFKKLLWTNSDPSAGFAAQTLSMDLSKYEGVVIRVSVGTNYNTDALKPYQTFNYIPKDGVAHYLHSLLDTSGTSNAYWARQVTVTDSGITFSIAGYPASTLATTSTNVMIPTEIYGYVYEPDIKYTETSLWTNSAPTSAFAAQDVTLSDDIDNYKYIKFKYRNHTANDTENRIILSVEDLKKSVASYGNNRVRAVMDSVVSADAYGRIIIYVDNTTINFTTAYHATSSATSNTPSIPLEIVGLNELDTEVIPQAKELLWLNPSPSATFAAQTLSMDLSKYDAVVIRCSWATNYNTDAQKPFQVFNYVPKDGNSHWITSSLGTGSALNLYGRTASVTNEGITFSLAGYGAYSGGTSTTNIIPTEIYGLTQNPEEHPQDNRKIYS